MENLVFITGLVNHVEHCGFLLDEENKVFTGFDLIDRDDFENETIKEVSIRNLFYLEDALTHFQKGWRSIWKTPRGIEAEKVFAERVAHLNICHTSLNTIFVSIPTYRDPEVVETIKDLFKKADNPERIIVGVCQQIDLKKSSKDDIDLRKTFPYQFSSGQMRIDTMDYKDAKGPCLARERIEKFCLRDEDFVLMIDAHMVFAPSWDTKILLDWYAIDDPMAILTTYPKEYKENRGWTDSEGTFLVGHSWKQNDLPLFALRSYYKRPNIPVPCISWVAGFSFLPRHIVKKVPYLSKVPYLFIGEEIAMGARYFTHGCNFYAPTFSVVQTTYKHRGKRKFEELDFQRGIRMHSEGFIRALVGMRGDGDLSKYDSPSRLGVERSLYDFETYSGISLSRKKITMNGLSGLTSVDNEETKSYKWENDEAINTMRSRRMFQAS